MPVVTYVAFMFYISVCFMSGLCVKDMMHYVVTVILV